MTVDLVIFLNLLAKENALYLHRCNLLLLELTVITRTLSL